MGNLVGEGGTKMNEFKLMFWEEKEIKDLFVESWMNNNFLFQILTNVYSVGLHCKTIFTSEITL
jgi:hypothetical protein